MTLNRISDVNANNTYQKTFDDDEIGIFATRCHFANFDGKLAEKECIFGKSEPLSEVSAQNTTRLFDPDYSAKKLCFLDDYGRGLRGLQILAERPTPFQPELKSARKTGVISLLLSSAVGANNLLDCISIILYTIKTKDRTTYGHSLRIAEYANRIASALELDALTRKKVALTAVLHDVGKLGISNAILMKPGILRDEEWDEMKNHSAIGAKIVKMLPKLKSISQYIRFHHERYDGNGYPDRLRQKEIPLVSRIIAIADAYDAMTQKRPYRAPLSKKQALAELEKQKGKQFDPNILRAFVILLRRRSARKAKNVFH